eukprot:403355625
MAEPTSDAVSTIVIGNFVLNLLLATSLQYLWGMINALQLILHMPLFKVNFPSNTNFVFNQIISVSTFDVIPSEEALEKMHFATNIHFLPYEEVPQSNEQVEKYYGSLYEGLQFDHFMNVIYNVWFVLRRLSFGIMAVFFEDSDSTTHFLFLMMQSLLFVMYVMIMKPFESSLLNKMEAFNEICILGVVYHFFLFSDYITDEDIKYDAGWSACFVLAIQMLVNISVMMTQSYQELKTSIIKLYYKIKLRMSKQAHIQIQTIKTEQIDSVKLDQKKLDIGYNQQEKQSNSQWKRQNMNFTNNQEQQNFKQFENNNFTNYNSFNSTKKLNVPDSSRFQKNEGNIQATHISYNNDLSMYLDHISYQQENLDFNQSNDIEDFSEYNHERQIQAKVSKVIDDMRFY